ncbi:hypothetical protein NU195Hw_g5568t1 [Hortaea werneckii]
MKPSSRSPRTFLPLVCLGAALAITPVASSNTTFCTTACVNWGYHYDYCTFYDPVNSQSVPSCVCYDPYSSEQPWLYYATLLGCTQCNEDGLGEEDLAFYQQWAAVCNVFKAAGNDAAETAMSYGQAEPIVSAFSASLLPELQSHGGDGGVQVQFPVVVNSTTTTVGGDGLDGQSTKTSVAAGSPAATSSLAAPTTTTNAAANSSSTSDADEGEDESSSENESGGGNGGESNTSHANSVSPTSELLAVRGWTGLVLLLILM